MSLSPTTIQNLETSKSALQDYLAVRTGEIDDLAKNLRSYGVPLDSLAQGTTTAAAKDALASIQTFLR